MYRVAINLKKLINELTNKKCMVFRNFSEKSIKQSIRKYLIGYISAELPAIKNNIAKLINIKV